MFSVPSRTVILATLIVLSVSTSSRILASPQETSDDALQAALAGFQSKIERNDLAGAIADLESVRASRSDAPAQVDAILGALYVEVGRNQEALDLLEALITKNTANPAVFYNAGRAALNVGNVQLADRYLTRAVRSAPSSPAARELGLLRGQLGQIPDSYALLNRWVADHPDDREARLAAAAGAVQLQRPLEAETLLSDLPAQDLGVRLLWGRTLLLKGDPYGAIGYLEPLLEDAPEVMQSDVRGTLVEAYNLIGDSESAVALLDGKNGDDPKMSLSLAIALYRNGNLERAIATLGPHAEGLLAQGTGGSAAVLDRRLRSGIALEYGRFLVGAGRAAEGLPYLELAVSERPDSQTAWQSLGQALAASGDKEGAQRALERFQAMAQSRPDSADAAAEDLSDPTGKVLRDAIESLGTDPERALERIRSEAAIAPQDPRPRLYEARALLLLERSDEALPIAQELAESLQGRGAIEADALYLVGSAQMAQGKVEPAEAALRRALQIVPDHTGVMSDLAVILMSKNQNEEAKGLLRRVLELRPGDPLASQNLGLIEAKG